MDFSKFPNNWFNLLGFKPFIVNTKEQSSLWCFCNTNISPTVISSSDQFVAFSFVMDNCLLASADVYASNNLIKRTDLCLDLSNIFSLHPLPWSFVGDFNAIIGANEHRGRNSHARTPMTNFKNWYDSSILFHLPTFGARFTCVRPQF